jgi:hypothetical protein
VKCFKPTNDDNEDLEGYDFTGLTGNEAEGFTEAELKANVTCATNYTGKSESSDLGYLVN